MKSRVLLYGFVVIVIGLFITWIARNTYWEDVSVPMPLQGEAIGNPFYATQHLAEALGASTEWRKALGELPPTNAVIVLRHWNWALLKTRREQLEHWVEGGGRLLVDSTFIPGDEHFAKWSGVSRESIRRKGSRAIEKDGDEEEQSEPADTGRNRPAEICGDLRVTATAAVAQDTQSFSVCTLDLGNTLRSHRDASWSLADEERTQAVRMPVGRGSVTMLNAAPFGNRELLTADHALLFVAATQLHAGDLIVFLSEEHYSSILSQAWAHGAPALVLMMLLITAALWRNGDRFGPPAPGSDVARRSLAEQIIGTGHFTLRVGGGRALHGAAVRALHEAAAKRIPGYARMSAEDRVTHMAKIAHTDAGQLGETINYAGTRRSRDFRHAIELLESVRRRLLEETSAREIAHAG